MNEASFLLLRKNDLNVKKRQHLYPYSDKGLKGTGVTRHPLSGRSFEVTSTVLKEKNIYIYCSGKSEHSEAKPAL